MNRPTNKHIKFCLKKVNELRQFGIEPVMVFDGAPMPSKAGVHSKRAE
jgi:exonuclease-1